MIVVVIFISIQPKPHRAFLCYDVSIMIRSRYAGEIIHRVSSVAKVSRVASFSTGQETKQPSNQVMKRFPQEALDQLYIIKSKDRSPSSTWSHLLETFRNKESGEIPIHVEHELLKQIADSKNRNLLQHATEKLEWTDPESLRLLILAWATIMKEPKMAARILLDWPLTGISSSPTLSSFRIVLTGLAKEKDYLLATTVLEFLIDKHLHLSPDRDCFHRVLAACSTQPQAAEETLLKMIQYTQANDNSTKTLPNIQTYRLLFTSWANSNQPGAGERAYELLQSCPLEPDTMCCNLVLNALANDSEYLMAQDLLHEMLQKRRVDRISFYTLFKAYDKANTIQATEQAHSFLYTLEGATAIPKHFKLPNARLYASVIGMWAKLGRSNNAWKLLKELEAKEENHFKPDQICYQAVIGSLSKDNSKNRVELAQKAQNLLESMQKQDYKLNIRTCNTVLKCWARAKRPAEAEKQVLNRMAREWDVFPDIVSYNTVIQAYARKGDAKRADYILQQLLSPSSNIRPNTRTFTGILNALARQRTVQSAEKAEELLKEMQDLYETQKMNTQPDLYAYNAVLNCWASQGNGPRAELFFRDELERFEKPDVTSYNSIIHAYQNNLAKGEELLQEMIGRNISPNDITQRTLLKSLNGDDSISKKSQKANQIKQKYF